jgi:hypothetical protein
MGRQRATEGTVPLPRARWAWTSPRSPRAGLSLPLVRMTLAFLRLTQPQGEKLPVHPAEIRCPSGGRTPAGRLEAEVALRGVRDRPPGEVWLHLVHPRRSRCEHPGGPGGPALPSFRTRAAVGRCDSFGQGAAMRSLTVASSSSMGRYCRCSRSLAISRESHIQLPFSRSISARRERPDAPSWLATSASSASTKANPPIGESSGGSDSRSKVRT